MTALGEAETVRARRIPWQALFAAVSVIWGSSFLFIKVLVDADVPPLDVALARIALGMLTLLAVLAWRRERLPSDARLWAHLLVLGALWNAVPFTLFAYAETEVSSVLAGLLNATVPLMTLAAVLAAFPEEHPTRERVAGLAVGFAGVAVVLSPWKALGGGEALGQLACLGAAACYGVAGPYTRRHLAGREESGLAMTTAQLICATGLLAIVAPLAGRPALHLGADGVASLLALGMLGSGIAFVLMHAIIRTVGATTASTVAYAMPLVSTGLGIAVLGEGMSANQPIGAAVVLLGIAISQGRLRRSQTPIAADRHERASL